MTNNTITLTRSEMQQVLDALEEMKGEIADWGSYASEYFKKKHDLDGSVNRFNPLIETLRARLAKKEFVVPPIDGDTTPWVRSDEGW